MKRICEGSCILSCPALTLHGFQLSPAVPCSCLVSYVKQNKITEGLELQKAEIRALPLPWCSGDMKDEEEFKEEDESHGVKCSVNLGAIITSATEIPGHIHSSSNKLLTTRNIIKIPCWMP
ncbi:hypothetical protein DV515_00001945 [Chloebia gouldiae]|uniref:Uncharacterized protein n=1 Tax=Chloebia gouldiae TaxID=44316 RepID=A0A3L8SXI7_CHLGU|nr:hypothetical protein DV515_00001945 [Chloebia gouldiae]